MKRRGRPTIDPSGQSVHVQMRVAAADYDAADQLARRTRESIQTVIRRGLKEYLSTHGRPTPDR